MPERRAHIGARPEIREATDGTPSTLVGHASVFDQWTTLYEGRYWVWREIVRPGAYANAIRDKQDVRALFNHDPNLVLGRTASGTLDLEEDNAGLMTRTVLPDTQTIRDLVVAPIRRGDVTGMSFAFSVRKGGTQTRTENPDGSIVLENGGERVTIRREGDVEYEDRELLDLDIFDISPVTYPAYEGTDVAARSRMVPDMERRIAERDVPHRAYAPWRDEVLRWLDSVTSAESAGK